MVGKKEPRVLICLASTDAWYSRILKWATKSDVSHVFFKHEDSFWDEWRATEIDERGVHDCSISKLRKFSYIEHWECGLSLLKGLRSSKEYVGSSNYDWFGVVFGLLRLIWYRLTGRRVVKSIHSKDRWFCSEFASMVLYESGIPGSDDFVYENITPEDLRKFFRKSEYFMRSKNPLLEAGQIVRDKFGMPVY